MLFLYFNVDKLLSVSLLQYCIAIVHINSVKYNAYVFDQKNVSNTHIWHVVQNFGHNI